LELNCIKCNINQVIKITDLLEIDRNKKEKIMRDVLKYLHEVDYAKCNPEIMGGTWNIILNYIENKNPYGEIKEYYNIETIKILDKAEELIKSSNDYFNTALKVAVAGNLIDFAAKHKFDFNFLKEKIENINEVSLAIDDSKELYNKLKTAKTLVYLGDNCGEICFDKLFIKYIKAEFPDIKVYFGVRGKAIVNDVTLEDAKMVAMEEVAEIIENGDDSLGTVIGRVSNDFKEKFYNADVVISKGQGNYESLREIDRDNVFHLFMAKCKTISALLNVKHLSILCLKDQPRT